jgi:hypothetical protein
MSRGTSSIRTRLGLILFPVPLQGFEMQTGVGVAERAS